MWFEPERARCIRPRLGAQSQHLCNSFADGDGGLGGHGDGCSGRLRHEHCGAAEETSADWAHAHVGQGRLRILWPCATTNPHSVLRTLLPASTAAPPNYPPRLEIESNQLIAMVPGTVYTRSTQGLGWPYPRRLCRPTTEIHLVTRHYRSL